MSNFLGQFNLTKTDSRRYRKSQSFLYLLKKLNHKLFPQNLGSDGYINEFLKHLKEIRRNISFKFSREVSIVTRPKPDQ